MPSYSGRGSHSGSEPGPAHGSTPCSVRKPWSTQVYVGCGADPRRDLVQQVRQPLHRADPVEDAGAALLRRVDDPGRQVADVDDLDRVVG